MFGCYLLAYHSCSTSWGIWRLVLRTKTFISYIDYDMIYAFIFYRNDDNIKKFGQKVQKGKKITTLF